MNGLKGSRTMQTFLPTPSFLESAEILDSKRLGKQRVEVLQILKSLAGLSPGWKNHPATRMWKGAEASLITYGIAICKEWKRRGFKDTCEEKILAFRPLYVASPAPSWLGNPDFHASHRSNLLRKNPEFYGKFGWSESPSLEYVWPLNSPNEVRRTGKPEVRI